MGQIPANFVHTRATPFWNKETAPKTLLNPFSTKDGVYGRLSVMQGAVKCMGFPDPNASEQVIEAGTFGIAPPQTWQRIELLTDDTYFTIDFFADPEVTLSGAGLGKVINTHKE